MARQREESCAKALWQEGVEACRGPRGGQQGYNPDSGVGEGREEVGQQEGHGWLLSLSLEQGTPLEKVAGRFSLRKVGLAAAGEQVGGRQTGKDRTMGRPSAGQVTRTNAIREGVVITRTPRSACESSYHCHLTLGKQGEWLP